GLHGAWREVPLAALARFSLAPRPVALLLAAITALASALFLTLAVHRSASAAQQLLLRLSEDCLLPRIMRAPPPRVGTPSRLIDLIAFGQLAIVIGSAGQTEWLARAYAIVIGCGAILKIATLIRLRRLRPEPRAFRVAINPRLAGREWPIGLAGIATALAVP